MLPDEEVFVVGGGKGKGGVLGVPVESSVAVDEGIDFEQFAADKHFYKVVFFVGGT